MKVSCFVWYVFCERVGALVQQLVLDTAALFPEPVPLLRRHADLTVSLSRSAPTHTLPVSSCPFPPSVRRLSISHSRLFCISISVCFLFILFLLFILFVLCCLFCFGTALSVRCFKKAN